MLNLASMFQTTSSNTTNLHAELGFTTTTYTLLLVYHTTVTLLSFVGNIIVMYGSRKYNAINVDEVGVITVECLAVTDILVALTSCVPILITLLQKHWVLGDTLCFFLAYVQYVPAISENLIILLNSLYRVFNLSFPMRARLLSGSTAKRTFIMIYCFAGLHTIGSVLLSGRAVFIPKESTCGVAALVPEFRVYGGISVLLLSLIPAVLMLVVNLLILYLVGQHQGKRGMTRVPSAKALTVTCAISWVYIISVLPKGIKDSYLAAKATPPHWLDTFQKEAYFLNTACNPIVYTLTNSDFRRFVKRLFTRQTDRFLAENKDVLCRVSEFNLKNSAFAQRVSEIGVQNNSRAQM